VPDGGRRRQTGKKRLIELILKRFSGKGLVREKGRFAHPLAKLQKKKREYRAGGKPEIKPQEGFIPRQEEMG